MAVGGLESSRSTQLHLFIMVCSSSGQQQARGRRRPAARGWWHVRGVSACWRAALGVWHLVEVDDAPSAPIHSMNIRATLRLPSSTDVGGPGNLCRAPRRARLREAAGERELLARLRPTTARSSDWTPARVGGGDWAILHRHIRRVLGDAAAPVPVPVPVPVRWVRGGVHMVGQSCTQSTTSSERRSLLGTAPLASSPLGPSIV